MSGASQQMLDASTGRLRRRAPEDAWLLRLVIALAVAYTAMFLWTSRLEHYNAIGAVVIGPVLVALAIPFLRYAYQREDDPWVGNVVVLGFFAKILGALARYFVAGAFFGGAPDATVYGNWGTAIAEQIRAGQAVDVGRDYLVGSGFVRLITGLLFAVTGPTRVGGFLVFAILSYVGLYLFHRAFALAVPDGNRRLYAVLVFLLPSIVYWPSSIGKEAWLTLTIGITAYAVARLLAGRRHWLVVLLLGLAGTTMVRPHFSALLVASLVFALLLGRSVGKRRGPGALARIVAIVVLVAVSFQLGAELERFFGVESIDLAATEEIFASTQQRTDTGGSATDASLNLLRQPHLLPLGIVTVLFRPFPFEVANVQGFLTSLEGVGLIALFVYRRRSIWAAVRSVRSVPYVAFATSFALAFVVAWSAIGNYGILARQRTLVLPFVLVLIAFAGPPSRPYETRSPRASMAERTTVTPPER
jgi:hypothetical protein